MHVYKMCVAVVAVYMYICICTVACTVACTIHCSCPTCLNKHYALVYNDVDESIHMLHPVYSVAIMRLVANYALKATYCSPTMEK